MSASFDPVRSACAIASRAAERRPALKYAQASASSVKMSRRSDAAFSAIATASGILRLCSARKRARFFGSGASTRQPDSASAYCRSASS